MTKAKRDRRNRDLAKFEEVYKTLHLPPSDPVEQTLWALLARSGSRADATRAWEAMGEVWIDVNEIRVANSTEIAGVIEPHVKGDAMDTADDLRGFLRQIFSDHFRVDLAFADEMDLTALRRYLVARPDHGGKVAMAIILKSWVEFHESPPPEAESNGEPPRPRKHTERELDTFMSRLRLLESVAAHGRATCKSKLVNCARCVLEVWSPTHGSIKRVQAERHVRKAAAAKRAAAAKKAAAAAAAKLAAAAPVRVVKLPAKKVVVKKAVAKKVVAKKAVAKKAVAKKAPGKKTAAKAAKKAKKTTPKVAKKTRKASARTTKTSTRRGGKRALPRTTRNRKRPSAPRKSSRR